MKSLANGPTAKFSPLCTSSEEIRKIIAPYLLETHAADSSEWTGILDEHYKKLRVQQFKKQLRRLFLGSIKSVRRVKGGYQQVWSLDMYPGNPVVDDSIHYLRWGQQGFKIQGWAEKRFHLFILAQAIHTLKPKTVLEVGSGNGGMSMMLAEMCPADTRFHGIELTETGVGKARQIQALNDLPAGMRRFLPLPQLSPGAFKQIDFQVGNAKQLPFPNRSIDLVFTSLALEQMRAVQSEVLTEIARVSNGYALMIEPFPDFNTSREQRAYTRANEYFSVPISELAKYGLNPVDRLTDIPCKIYRGAGAVLARPGAY